MLKKLPHSRLQQIVDFINDNYVDNLEGNLFPKTVEDLLEQNGNDGFYLTEDDYGIEAICFVTIKHKTIAEVHRAVVRLDVRGQGVFNELFTAMENQLRLIGVKKLQTFIFTNNIPSIVFALKRHGIIEGVLRNQDGKGASVYVVGKEIG